MKYRLVIFISALLSMLMMTVFSSCEKEEDESEKDESYEIQVAVENYLNEVVYLYIDDNFMYMISAGKNWNYECTNRCLPVIPTRFRLSFFHLPKECAVHAIV